MEKNLSIAKIQSIVIPLLDVIIGLSSLLTLIYGGYLALIGDITLGRFVAFNQYINMLVWPMLACGDSVNMFPRVLLRSGESRKSSRNSLRLQTPTKQKKWMRSTVRLNLITSRSSTAVTANRL